MKTNSSWDLLKILKPCPPIPWLCASDFNEILHQREKVGGARRPYNHIENFRQALEICGICDIHSKGQKFTWSNNRRGKEFTKERIDRAMANKEWNELFNQAYCNIMVAIKSDHSPLHVNLQHIEYGRGRRNKIFRYEATWELKEDCGGVVKVAWNNDQRGDTQAGMLRFKLNLCKRDLLNWKEKATQQAKGESSRILTTISQLQDNGDGSNIDQLQILQRKIEVSPAETEMKWRQRAKQHWLRNGDKNTRYFHMQANQRRKTNSIKSIADNDGNVAHERRT
ncbi:hypothetical protein F2P56_031530 [Juglans regia]|uniref:Uncharacterized protein n=2 Tax=Juglans regia TaxID=51240 RepID=A0A833TYI2_JUGRE|nr:uncharacterized protein LOC109001487 [Juglans regia]KAF5445848.1 hypothetical protein F2P56_031530 [Juglans regia]